MGTISKNFSYKEFERSATADRKGICNVIRTFEVRDAVKELTETILQPLRDAWGKPLHINSGYRCPELNRAVGGVPTSQHCFDDMTEILTDNGWKSNETISLDDKVFTYNFGTSEIELKPINEIIRRQFNGQLFRISGKHIDIVCTDKHNVIVKYDYQKYKRRGSNKISPEGQAYFDTLKTNNREWHLEKMDEVFGKRRLFMTCGYIDENANYDVGFMKFIMAVVSDGYFGFHCGKTPYIGFHVKKERKIKYLCDLMSVLDIKYSMRKEKNGTVYFYIGKAYAEKALEVIGKNKNLPYYILKADSNTLRELINTYAFFDGCKDKRNNNIGINISTVNSHNASILQAMCVLSGMRCVLSSHEGVCGIINGKRIKNARRFYTLSICPDLISSKVKESSSEKIKYNGEVWCIRDDNDTVIVRRNGKVSIQGNCKGEACDVACDKPAELARLAILLHLPYDQIILYPTFVHFSHKLHGEQRYELLYNKSYKGEKV